jgi:regulator of replication initiation timing
MSRFIPVEPEKWAEMVKAMAENRLLKAELEETKDALFKHSTENHRLQVERQRLTKAGDAMAKVIDDDYLDTLQVWIDWNAAKEGKQP